MLYKFGWLQIKVSLIWSEVLLSTSTFSCQFYDLIFTIDRPRYCPNAEMSHVNWGQGWFSGDSVGLHPITAQARLLPSVICGLSLLVLALLRGFFSDSPVFLPQQKPTSPNSNSTRIEDRQENHLLLISLPL